MVTPNYFVTFEPKIIFLVQFEKKYCITNATRVAKSTIHFYFCINEERKLLL